MFIGISSTSNVANIFIDDVVTYNSVPANIGATAPTGVTTGTAGSITASGATISTSSVTADGGSAITERGVVYATTSNPTISNTKVTASGTTGNFDSTLTGLAASTTYYVRAYATNSVGTTYGSEVSFTTASASSPTISTTGSPSAVSTTYGTASSGTSFNVSGVNMNAGITVTPPAGFEVSTSSTFASGVGNSTSPITVGSSGTIASTTVYVRLAAATVPGNYSGNIQLTSSSAAQVNVATVSSTVSQKALTVTGHTGVDKVYDGLTTATAGGSGSLSGGLVGSDTVTLSGTPTWTFANAAVGTAKTVTASGYSLDGAQAARYSLTQPTVTANITTRALTVAANDVSKASGTALTGGAGSTAFTSSGLQNGETIGSVTITYGDAATTSGNGSTLGTYIGQVTPSAATGGTFTASNYAISYSSGNITVLSAPSTITRWTFETSTPGGNNTSTTGTTISSISAEEGTGTASGVHASASTSWSNPPGNGTPESFSANNWTVGDYFQFQTSTTGFSSISLDWDQRGSNTGPANFKVQYSTDGSNYTDAPSGSYSVSNQLWDGVTRNSTSGKTLNLSGVTALNNAANIYIRLVQTNTTAVNGGTVAATGTGVVDTFTISGYAPSISINGSSSFTAADYTTTYGTASANQTFAITATNLLANITATAGTGFEVSSDGTTYGPTATFTNSSGTASGTLYARLAANASASATYTSATVATLTSTSAATRTISTDSDGSDVTQATPTVSVAPTASAITYGQALSASTITPGTSSVAGTYDFVSPSTTPAVGTASQSITFTPTDSGNYTTASTSASVTVNQAPLTITSISIDNKTYDGTNAATISGTAAYSGLVLGQSFGVSGSPTASFGNSTVGSNKPVTVSGYTAPNGNYSITQPTGLTGNITAASVTVTAGNQTKTFGASDPALTYTPSPALIAGNSFTGALSRAAGEGVGTYAISQGTLSAGSNYTITFVGANLTITQATPTITTAPTASTITSGQALSSSVLSGGVANVAGSFAFTTPATVPSPGISSQGVTFTPTDTGNYTAQTTSVNVGVLCTAPVLTRATLPTGTGFTVNWGAVTGAGNYTVLHSASKNMSSATSADTTSTSLTLTVSPGIRFVQVRANNAAGASANSTMQVNQLRSLAAGSTTYLSVPGVVNGGNATIAEIFGSNNEAGLEVGGNDSTSTNILRLNDNGSTQPGVWYFSGNWVRADTIVNTEIIPAGKAFMLRNRSSVVDHILLVGTPAEGPPAKVNITASGGNHTLMTPARTQSTALNALNLRPPGGNSTNQIKAATIASQADLVIVPRSTGLPRGYYFDATMNGGAGGWRSAGGNPIADPTTISVPSGGAFFIRKASDSTFTEWTPPAEE